MVSIRRYAHFVAVVDCTINGAISTGLTALVKAYERSGSLIKPFHPIDQRSKCFFDRVKLPAGTHQLLFFGKQQSSGQINGLQEKVRGVPWLLRVSAHDHEQIVQAVSQRFQHFGILNCLLRILKHKKLFSILTHSFLLTGC